MKKLEGKVAVKMYSGEKGNKSYLKVDFVKDVLIKRIESLHGVHTIERANELGVGTREYELIEIE